MESIDAPALARERGDELQAKLVELDRVTATRGMGLLVAAELDTDVVGMTGPEVAAACLGAGLVVNGISPTAIRFAPPLTVSSEEIDEALAIFASVIGAT